MSSKLSWGVVLVGLLVAIANPAQAEKPDWAGGGHGKKHAKQDEFHREDGMHAGVHFDEEQRHAAMEYYDRQAQKKHCPPGLAKKNNGCMPPGQAKQWQRGAPLPGVVVQYPVPKDVVVKIGLPPKGYKYVRVANDILLVAIGTSIVVDAIEDLMR